MTEFSEFGEKEPAIVALHPYDVRQTRKALAKDRDTWIMERQTEPRGAKQHDTVKQTYDEVQSDGRYEEGMARMALYHHHCQDPVIFRTLGDIRGKSLLDLACGDGFYTRRFRTERGANPVMRIDIPEADRKG